MSKQYQVISVLPDAALAVENLVDWTEYWDIKQACETLGRSRRTVARYIDNGTLSGVKIAGPRGPEWRIVPFSVKTPSDLSASQAEAYTTEIEKLKVEIETLKSQRQAQSHHDALVQSAISQEINPGILQAVVSFFLITGVRLGLAPRTIS